MRDRSFFTKCYYFSVSGLGSESGPTICFLLDLGCYGSEWAGKVSAFYDFDFWAVSYMARYRFLGASEFSYYGWVANDCCADVVTLYSANFFCLIFCS